MEWPIKLRLFVWSVILWNTWSFLVLISKDKYSLAAISTEYVHKWTETECTRGISKLLGYSCVILEYLEEKTPNTL